MTISVFTRLDRKYMLPATTMTNPYTEERNGHLFLVDCVNAILCDSIVSIDVI